MPPSLDTSCSGSWKMFVVNAASCAAPYDDSSLSRYHGQRWCSSVWKFPTMFFLLFFFFCVPSYIPGVHHFGWDFCVCDRFWSNYWGSHFPSSWMMHAGCVFVAGIHPSRTWMSGSFQSLQWNACVHRLDLGLYSHPKEFWGNGVRTYVNSKGKIPSTRGSEKDQTDDAVSCRTASPTHYRLSCPGPVFCYNYWQHFCRHE